MRTWFLPDITDSETGAIIVPDFDCWIECSLRADGSLEVDEVLIDGEEDQFGRLIGARKLWSEDPLSQALYCRVVDAAEEEFRNHGRLYDEVMEAEAENRPVRGAA